MVIAHDVDDIHRLLRIGLLVGFARCHGSNSCCSGEGVEQGRGEFAHSGMFLVKFNLL